MREALSAVIASEAKQSRVVGGTLDCFVACAPRNDGKRDFTFRPDASGFRELIARAREHFEQRARRFIRLLDRWRIGDNGRSRLGDGCNFRRDDRSRSRLGDRDGSNLDDRRGSSFRQRRWLSNNRGLYDRCRFRHYHFLKRSCGSEFCSEQQHQYNHTYWEPYNLHRNNRQ